MLVPKTDRKAGAVEVDLHLLAHRQADAAILLGHGQPEQAHFLHGLDQLGRYLVVFFEMVLGGHQPFTHETLNGGQQELE